MFFIGVFGIEDRNKEIRGINNFACKSCTSLNGRLIKEFTCFHFFFIPLFKWNVRYYIVCNGCRTVFRISKEKGEALENSSTETVSYWDLEEMNYRKDNVCPTCGRELNENFEYCPYCGRKL